MRALYTEMLDKARQRPETLYGSSPAQIARAKIQTLAVADEFPSVMQDLIAVGVKTHFIYHVVAKNNAYKRPLPDVFEDRPGQMDAFGIASGLVAIHTRRPDNSFLEFVRRDNPESPIFTGFSKANGMPVDVPGMTEPVTEPSWRPIASSRTFRRGRRRCRRPSTSRASTGRSIVITPTGMAIRAPRRAPWPQAHRRRATRAW